MVPQAGLAVLVQPNILLNRLSYCKNFGPINNTERNDNPSNPSRQKAIFAGVETVCE